MHYFVASGKEDTCGTVPEKLLENPAKSCKGIDDGTEMCICVQMPEEKRQMIDRKMERMSQWGIQMPSGYNNQTGFFRKCGECEDPCQNRFRPDMSEHRQMMMEMWKKMGGGGGLTGWGSAYNKRMGGSRRYRGSWWNKWNKGGDDEDVAEKAVELIMNAVVELVKDQVKDDDRKWGHNDWDKDEGGDEDWMNQMWAEDEEEEEDEEEDTDMAINETFG